MENKSKPIGYWLKEVDRLIEDGLDRALVERDMTRRQWQVMNVLRGAAHDDDGLVTALRPFWGPGTTAPAETVGELIRRGWVTRDDTDRYGLTGPGEAALAAAAEHVDAFRRAVAAGVTPEEYATTVRVLQRMAANLDM